MGKVAESQRDSAIHVGLQTSHRNGNMPSGKILQWQNAGIRRKWWQ